MICRIMQESWISMRNFIKICRMARLFLLMHLTVMVLQQLDGNIIGPKILGNTTGLSSFWVLFAILLFGGLWGFAGMIGVVGLRRCMKTSEKNFLERKTIEHDSCVFVCCRSIVVS